MNTIGAVISEFYPKLLTICEKRNIALNLDLENPSVKVFQEKALRKFLKDFTSLAVKSCQKSPEAKQHIAIVQKSIPGSEMSRISIKYSGETMTAEQKELLQKQGYKVRARFGFDTIISVDL